MRRIVALLAAVAMVVGAVVARQAIDDRDASPAGPGEASGPLRVVCSPDLAEVCTAKVFGAGANITIEPPLVTLNRLSKAGADPADDADLWLAPGPWGELLTAERSRSGADTAGRTGDVLARSALVAVVKRDRAAAQGETCDGRCLADVAGDPWTDLGGDATWGRAKVAFPDPLRTGTGLVTLGAITADLFGTTALASADVDASEDYLDALRTLATDVARRPNFPRPVAAMVVNPAGYDIVMATESDARFVIGEVAERRFLVECATPPGTAEIRPVLFSARADAAVSPSLRSALADLGWVTSPPIAPDDPRNTATCDAGDPATQSVPAVLLLRLAELWKQAA